MNLLNKLICINMKDYYEWGKLDGKFFTLLMEDLNNIGSHSWINYILLVDALRHISIVILLYEL